MFLPDLSPNPADASIVARLKRDALAKLSKLPEDQDAAMQVIGRKLDYLASAALKIAPKETEGGLAPFVYNPIQMDYLAGLRLKHRTQASVDLFRGVRDLILKPRQLGFTTFIASLFFLDGLLNPGRNSLVLTHLDKISQEVLSIYRTFFDCLLPELKQSVRLRRASALHLELEFLGPDGLPDPVRLPASSFMVHTAEGLDLRGLTIHNLHASEAAFYKNWAELLRGVFQAVPKSGNIILESTANGFNHYKDLVDASLEGKGAWRLVFYPWFAHDEYSRPLSRLEADEFLASLDKDERLLHLEHKVALPQLAWRRDKVLEMGGFVDSFRQEYPANIQDAFITTGRPIFDLRTVAANWELTKKAAAPEEIEEGVWVFAPYERGMVVVCGADPAEGIDKGEGDPVNEIGGNDYSAAFFLDARNLRVVAYVHGRFEPVEFARKLARVGALYDSMIGVERNNHGHLVCYALEEAGYPQLYRHLEYDASGTQFLKLGFPMTPQTRPLVVDTLAEVVRRDALPCPVQRFWGEAMVFVRDPAGKPQAMPGRHDDRVMSMAIAVYLCTLGSKAWGGTGTLQNADDAGLPRAVPASLAVRVPPVVATVTLSPIKPVTEGGESEGTIHPFFTRLSEIRESHQAPDRPCCANCLHRQDRNGSLVCKLQGFTIHDPDPPCPVWEPPEAQYTEPGPGSFRLDIGGPP